MLSDEAKGLDEAINNAVEYYMEKGLLPTHVLTVLSNNRQAWKDKFVSEAAAKQVDEFLHELFGDGRGTE